ncbi:MAG: hypothetical protein ACFNUI_09620 [Negativicutes bacterium]
MPEKEIKSVFVKTFNQLFDNRNEILSNIKLVQKTLCSTDELEKKQDRLAGEMQVVSEMAHNAIRENASVAQDQTEYQKRYDELTKRYEESKAAYEKTSEEIAVRSRI